MRKSFLLRTTAGVLVFAAALLLAATVPAADKTAELDAYLSAACDVLRFQGAVLVADDGVPVFVKGYGMADVAHGQPNTPETEFLIGSVTKQFTAAAILQLQEQGTLSVHDPISKFLPDFPKATGDRITVHHLLTHTSGLVSYTDIDSLMARRGLDMTAREIVASFKDLPLQFEPGAMYRYCNSGYFLLGLIIEAVSGQTYADYLAEHIFRPLGMTHTTYPPNERTPNRAVGYVAPEDTLVPADPISMTLPYAAGALASTVGDLLIWDQALYGDRVLSEDSRKQMYTPALENYGYGWMVAERFGRREISHGGGIDGFTSVIARYPDDRLTIIVLCNNMSANAAGLGSTLAAIMFDQPYDRPVRKTPAAADPASFDALVGVYWVGDNSYRVIRRDGDNLYSQRTGGPVFQVFPEAPDKFFFENDNSTTLVFIRDQAGAVVAHLIHQSGVDTRCDRVTGPLADSLMAERAVVPIDPAVFARLVGDYELAPGFVLTFRARDGRFFSQATGQQEFEIFPAGETEYFLRVVDAQITFQLDPATGRATGLILHQGGRDMPAKKIK
ncbi:MAG TPA: serine hydrolase [candidate division Zixibacteria bacterium]|nr:serine hydrolase [candidate division Zixibacteria bacterium]